MKHKLENDGTPIDVEVRRFEYMPSEMYSDEIGVIFSGPDGGERCLYLSLAKVARLEELGVITVIAGDPPSYQMIGTPRLRFQKRKKTKGTGYVIDIDRADGSTPKAPTPDGSAVTPPRSPERVRLLVAGAVELSAETLASVSEVPEKAVDQQAVAILAASILERFTP